MNSNTEAGELDFAAAFGPLEQVVASLRGQIERLELRTAVDPDGELSTLDRTLRLKRGSRRV